MIILGIDPGIARTGYAILKQENNSIVLKDCGCITTKPTSDLALRLVEIKKDVTTLIKKWQPEALCLESLFFATNAKTAMVVGQARGVVMLTAGEHQLKILEVTPLQVKISTTGYGKADKAQVQRMVQTLLKLKKIPKPDDAADAAAIAWAGL